ncbi:MAG: response regulator transcription factor [Armatimonadota bacterium]
MAKILVADDEPNTVKLITRILTREGHELLTAGDGAEALELLEKHSPDLVILDVMMPTLDGFETLERIRKDPRHESLPVIMLTARRQPEDVSRGWATGADTYLTKPFSPLELTELVKRLLMPE